MFWHFVFFFYEDTFNELDCLVAQCAQHQGKAVLFTGPNAVEKQKQLLRTVAGKVLIKCQDYYLNHPDEKPAPGNTLQLKNGTLETYEDIAELAFGARGRQLISLILYTELLGTCALFLLLQKGMCYLQHSAMCHVGISGYSNHCVQA